MSNVSHKILFAFFAALFLHANMTLGAEPNNLAAILPEVKAVVIPCKGMIDDGLFKSIQRRSQLALDMGAEYIIYEIDTYGGLVKSADDISTYFIFEVGKKANTVAFITTKAISAGAMISVSCKDIIMRDYATIGDCAPIVMGGTLEGVEREKQESFIREVFDRASEANNYPTALLHAMVSIHISVYRVKNFKTGGYEFFEADQLPKDANEFDLENKQLIVGEDKILTLTASEALEYGIARDIVEDVNECKSYFAKRDGVTFAEKTVVLETNWSEEMVRWLNSPAVMGILVMVALLGVYVELNTPGLGLPGLIAVICFVIIVSSKFLIGMANWVEVAVFVIGIILLLIELFVLPGFGIVGGFGIIFILAGLFGMLVKNAPDQLPWPTTRPEWDILISGVLGIMGGFVGFVISAILVTRFLPQMEFMSGLILKPANAKTGEEFEVSMTASPDVQDRGLKVGDIGFAESNLRPAGKARFGDIVADVVTKAEFLQKGAKVRIDNIHGNKVVVKLAQEN